MASEVRKELAEAIDQIEGAYEYFLAYAAQGVKNEAQATKIGGQLRRHLDAMSDALSTLPTLITAVVRDEELDAGTEFEAFAHVIAADASRASAVVELVRAQTSITSQLVDNLNASVHVRTLLTDLFIVDEALHLGVDEATRPGAAQPTS